MCISQQKSVLFPFRIIGLFPTKDMQTPPLSFTPIFMIDAHSAESNEKSIFRFDRPPPVHRPWTLHAFGLRKLALLVSV